jgi:uncharacterized membrane protein
MVSHPGWVRSVLTGADLDALARAVAEAEAATSGEIRVHLEAHLPGPRDAADDAVLARAHEVFERLGMTATRDRNAVLIYLALDDHRLAIVGDAGVHARVGDAYWASVRDGMVERLRAGRVREALVGAVAEVGRALGEHYPRRPDDVDELPDRPSLG